MKILQLINALTIGGAQSLALDLARYGAKNGHIVEIAAFRGGELCEAFKKEGFNVHIVGEAAFDIPAYFKLKQIIKNFKPDIIHSHLFRADLWARLCKQTFKDVVLITSLHGQETKLFHKLERLMGSVSDEIVVPSQFLKKWYLKNVKKRRAIAIIPPGAVIWPINRLLNAEAKQRPCVGTLSRLHPVKGLDMLLRACKSLLDEGFDFSIKIGGDGACKNRLQKLADELKISDKCEFEGSVTDKLGFLEQISVFAAPSRQEAFGISICEAMERGLAVVGANVGGIPELITNNKTGLLFEAENELSLKKALKTALSSEKLRERLGNAARARVLSSFNRIDAVKAYYDIYKKHLLKKKRILFAVSSNELGGGERLALSLMNSLKARGWCVSTLCAGKPLSEALTQSGIPCKTASVNCAGLFFALALLREIVVEKPRVISSHLNRAALFAGVWGRLFNIPVVSHIHGLNNKSYYSLSTSLIAVSKAVGEHMLKQGTDKNKLKIIANAINKKPVLSARTLPNSGILQIAITAKLHKNKGHEWVFRAISANRGNFRGISIAVFGDGPERTRLEALAEQLKIGDIVRFYGFVNNLDDYYQNINVVLLPSLGEGIPLSLLEAMRLGIPCIATNIGGIPEIVVDQKNGLLIEPKNATALAEALNCMASPQKYGVFSQNALEYYKKLNNYEQMISSFEAVINKLL